MRAFRIRPHYSVTVLVTAIVVAFELSLMESDAGKFCSISKLGTHSIAGLMLLVVSYDILHLA
jgi:hypothetical protein